MYVPIAEISFMIKHDGARQFDLLLVGKALEWAKNFPNGFPTCCKSGGADNLSAASNKHLKPLTGKTFHGYRHLIVDVLRNSECNDSVKDSIVSHKTTRFGWHYGEGYTLAKKRDALVIALGITEKRTMAMNAVSARFLQMTNAENSWMDWIR